MSRWSHFLSYFKPSSSYQPHSSDDRPSYEPAYRPSRSRHDDFAEQIDRYRYPDGSRKSESTYFRELAALSHASSITERSPPSFPHIPRTVGEHPGPYLSSHHRDIVQQVVSDHVRHSSATQGSLYAPTADALMYAARSAATRSVEAAYATWTAGGRSIDSIDDDIIYRAAQFGTRAADDAAYAMAEREWRRGEFYPYG